MDCTVLLNLSGHVNVYISYQSKYSMKSELFTFVFIADNCLKYYVNNVNITSVETLRNTTRFCSRHCFIL